MTSSTRLYLPDNIRPMHIYIPGKTRHGKSTLLFWMALQDIQRGQGVCVMDAKGDLVQKLIHFIPKNRVEDTLYLDIQTPVPLDLMGYLKEPPKLALLEKQAIIGELKYLLMKTVEPQHAPVMTQNLTDVLYTLLNANENTAIPPSRKTTFLDLYWFLENPRRREEVLSYCTDQDLLRRWRDDMPNHLEISRITSRMTPFVRSGSLRAIFGAPEPKLNITSVMNERKVLLVNLGPCDEIQRAYGTLLISKIRQAAYRRAYIPPSKRTPFYLYCDEFQEFQTSDFDKMLSMAGGFGLCLTLAHQFTEQLQPPIRESIMGNVSTFICFRVGHQSANCLKGEIPKQYADYLITLPVGRVLYRAADGSTRFITTPNPPLFAGRDSYADTIRKRTSEIYACNTPQESYSPSSESNAAASAPEETTSPKALPPHKRAFRRP